MDRADRSPTVSSVAKALLILDFVGTGPDERSLSEIAAATGIPGPTTHRLVRTLVHSGYLRQQPNRRYTVAPRLIALGRAASGVFGTWSAPILSGLVEALGETVNLAVLDGDQITYVAQSPSPHAMRMYTEVGRGVDAHCRAVGKAVLAQLPDSSVRALLRRTGLAAVTPNTITNLESMLVALAEVRERGYAVDQGELEVGVNCVAVPVLAPAVTPLIAMSISGPEARVTEALMLRAVPLLVQASRLLAAEFEVQASA